MSIICAKVHICQTTCQQIHAVYSKTVSHSSNLAVPYHRGMDEIITKQNAELMETLGGVSLIEVDKEKERVTLQFNCLPRFCHSGGKVAQGGFITAWIDAAMAHAIVLPSNQQQTIASLDINVRFLEICGPGVVRASGWVVRRGRRIATLAGELRDESGRLLATATSGGVLMAIPTDQ